MSSGGLAMATMNGRYSGFERRICQAEACTQIRLRTQAVCRVGARWMAETYGGYMYVLIFRVVPGGKTAKGPPWFPSMAIVGHRTTMCEYTFLVWLNMLLMLLLRL